VRRVNLDAALALHRALTRGPPEEPARMGSGQPG
jgi:hypothetical protein